MITTFLNSIHGKWKYQQTIYNLQTQKTNYHKDKFNFVETERNNHILDETKNEIVYEITELPITLLILKNEILKNVHITTHQKNIINYSVLNKTDNILKIEYSKNQLTYSETINIINSNFLISVSALKKRNNYIATGFTSYIKIIH